MIEKSTDIDLSSVNIVVINESKDENISLDLYDDTIDLDIINSIKDTDCLNH
jgi:hypothetical protein